MKILYNYLIVMTLSLTTSQIFGQAKFYEAISGTYLDGRTGEIVSLLYNNRFAGFEMFYQANEMQASQKTKVMKELITNEGKLWMKIRFNNSKYISLHKHLGLF